MPSSVLPWQHRCTWGVQTVPLRSGALAAQAGHAVSGLEVLAALAGLLRLGVGLWGTPTHVGPAGAGPARDSVLSSHADSCVKSRVVRPGQPMSCLPIAARRGLKKPLPCGKACLPCLQSACAQSDAAELWRRPSVNKPQRIQSGAAVSGCLQLSGGRHPSP